VTFPDVHLADEAVAAYVDHGLSPVAQHRAERHLRTCLECRGVVDAQQEAKVLLAAAPDPDLPTGLVARLRDIPMTTDLGEPDVVVFMDAQGLAWSPAGGDIPFPGEPRLTVAAEPAAEPGAEPGIVLAAAGPVAVAPGAGRRGTAAPRAASGRRPRPGGADRHRARPRSYPSFRSVPLRRGRRRLAGALAGLAFGVIASTASTAAPTAVVPVGQLGTGGGPPAPSVRGGSSSTSLELNTLRVGPDRPRSDLLPVGRR
jgi:hypothetical protein